MLRPKIRYSLTVSNLTVKKSNCWAGYLVFNCITFGSHILFCFCCIVYLFVFQALGSTTAGWGAVFRLDQSETRGTGKWGGTSEGAERGLGSRGEESGVEGCCFYWWLLHGTGADAVQREQQICFAFIVSWLCGLIAMLVAEVNAERGGHSHCDSQQLKTKSSRAYVTYLKLGFEVFSARKIVLLSFVCFEKVNAACETFFRVLCSTKHC